VKRKLAVITTHPIQYQTPIWRLLAQCPEIDIRVYFGSDFSVRGCWDNEFGANFAWDTPLTEGYSHTFLSTDLRTNSPWNLKLNIAEFKRQLYEFQADYALLNGYTPFLFYLKALIIIRLLRIPVIMRAEATDEAIERSAAKAAVRYGLLRVAYSQIEKFLAVGYNSRRHYLSKGVPENKIFFSPYNIDSDLFKRQAQEWLPRRTDIRQELGFGPEQFIFLYSGKLIAKKDPLTMVEGFRRLAEISNGTVGLIVMGEGHLRQQFETEMRSIPGVRTVFIGFQNQSKVGRFYSAADCLILSSLWGETWGLVVNEALQFGIPAIVSSRVGCRHDLIVEGETGFIFPVGDGKALAEKMAKAMEMMKFGRTHVRDACLRKASEYSLQKAVSGIREAVNH